MSDERSSRTPDSIFPPSDALVARLHWLPRTAVTYLGRTVAALEAIFKERFLGAYLVGVALHPTRHDRGRRPEVVAIVTDASAADVAALGEEAKSAMRAGIRIQLVSEWDLSRSADAFALQVADWKCHHAVLAGDDSRLAQVLVKREHVRLAAERRLREMQRRLRQLLLETHLVAGAPKTEVPEVAAQALDDLLVLARHVLPLLGEDAPEDEAARLAAVVDAAGGDTELLATAYARLHDGDRIPRPIALLDAFLPIFAALTDRVDALE